MSVIVYAGGDTAKEGVRKLRGAGWVVTVVDSAKIGGLKDVDIRNADAVILDATFASKELIRRIHKIGTPSVVVGSRRVSWSDCLRPVVAALRKRNTPNANG